MDDFMVKSMKVEDHTKNLSEVFEILKKYKVKLNPKKCVFEVLVEKVLGFIVSQRGIKANLEQF